MMVGVRYRKAWVLNLENWLEPLGSHPILCPRQQETEDPEWERLGRREGDEHEDKSRKVRAKSEPWKVGLSISPLSHPSLPQA